MVLDTNSTKIIHIKLLDEVVDVWRPTRAIQIENGFFRVLQVADYDPEDEEWEFLPGAIVRCEHRHLNGEDVLVAVEEIL